MTLRFSSRFSPRAGADKAGTQPFARTALTKTDLDILTRNGMAIGSPLGRIDARGARVLRAVDAKGRHVVAHIVDLPNDSSGAATWRRLADLRQLMHPCLARVRDVIALTNQRALVTIDLVDGADLAVVLGARGALTRSETARVLDDVGSALALMHEAGLAHGDVSTANVVITTAGGAVLVDLLGGVMESGTSLWAAPERVAGGAPTPASDVYSLAALLRSCAEGSALTSRRLKCILTDALAADPSLRPSARSLTARSAEIGLAGVIELPDGARLAAGALRAAAVTPTRTLPRRSKTGRIVRNASWIQRWRIVGAAISLIGVSTGILIFNQVMSMQATTEITAKQTHSTIAAAKQLFVANAKQTLVPLTQESARSTAAGAFTSHIENYFTDVVAHLAQMRDQALMQADAQALARVTVPGTTAAQNDSATLLRLKQAGESVANLSTSIEIVKSEQLPAGSATNAVALRVKRQQQAYIRTNSAGVQRSVPAQPEQEIVLVLVPNPWRVAQILPAQ